MKTAYQVSTACVVLGLGLLVASGLSGEEKARGGGAKSTAARAKSAAAAQVQVAADSRVGVKPTDWPQWGGSSIRNNTPEGSNIPAEWNVGSFDRRTGEWQKDKAENIKWVTQLGSQSYGNPVVANGKIYVGTNNGAGYLKRYPNSVDLGVLLCLNEKDGSFLWQHSSEKLPTGRVHDWPQQGICSAPLVEGDRLWFVSSRGEVLCLDTEGHYDGEDDGPVQKEWARQFELSKTDSPRTDKSAVIEAALAAFKDGKVAEELRNEFEQVGVILSDPISVKATEPGRKWAVTAKVGDYARQIEVRQEGPKLSAWMLTTPQDTQEADVVWRVNMMKELGTSQHNMCSCSVTAAGDILFVNTSNGVDEGHTTIPAPHAPSFLAMDKNTGKVLWTDNSPGINVLHGQWSSPSYAVLGGVPQVLFAGGDGWLYSFLGEPTEDGKAKLLWKFDCNPKESRYALRGKVDRNHLIGTPVIHDGLVYIGVGEDPEHGEGIGHLWCIDPTKRGDVSPELAFNVKDLTKPIPHRREQAVIKEEGEVARPNPNSAAVWHYASFDQDGDGKIEHAETMHRTCGTVAIKDGLLFVADFSGLFHCLDVKTGKPHWTYDMLAESWASPLIVDDKVYIGDADGDVAVFKLSTECELLSENNMKSSVYSTPIIANNILYIASLNRLFAIEATDAK